jgi:hypothetical protein
MSNRIIAPSPIKLLAHTKLLLRLAKHQKLLALIKAALPAPLDERCLDCCVNDKNCLLIYCENASWAFSLRFYAEHILSGIRAQGERVDSVQIRITTPTMAPPQRGGRHQYFSHNTAAEAISVVAATMQDDLGKSLDRLAATLSSTERR